MLRHHVLNIVRAQEGAGEAVLDRALEPTLASSRCARGAGASRCRALRGARGGSASIAVGRRLDGERIGRPVAIELRPAPPPGPSCRRRRIGIKPRAGTSPVALPARGLAVCQPSVAHDQRDERALAQLEGYRVLRVDARRRLAVGTPVSRTLKPATRSAERAATSFSRSGRGRSPRSRAFAIETWTCRQAGSARPEAGPARTPCGRFAGRRHGLHDVRQQAARGRCVKLSLVPRSRSSPRRRDHGARAVRGLRRHLRVRHHDRARARAVGPARSPVAGSILISAPATAAGAGQSCTLVPSKRRWVKRPPEQRRVGPPNTGPPWNA